MMYYWNMYQIPSLPSSEHESQLQGQILHMASQFPQLQAAVIIIMNNNNHIILDMHTHTCTHACMGIHRAHAWT